MTDEEEDVEIKETTSTDADGRSAIIHIEGYYKAQVWGDPEDSFDEVMERLKEASDRAIDDIKILQDMNESDGGTFQ